MSEANHPQHNSTVFYRRFLYIIVACLLLEALHLEMTPWFRAPRASLGLYTAMAMKHGDVPWRDVAWIGPVGPALLGIGAAPAGGGPAGGMALQLLLVICAALAAGSLGARLGSRGAGVAAAGTLAAFLLAPRVFDGGGEPAVTDACLSVIAAALLARNGRNTAWAVAAGLAAGAALLFRTDGVRPVGLLLGSGLVAAFAPAVRRRALLFAAGCCVPAAAMYLWASRHGVAADFLRSLGLLPAPPEWTAWITPLGTNDAIYVILLAAPLWVLPFLDAVHRRGRFGDAQKLLLLWFAVEVISSLIGCACTVNSFTGLAVPLTFMAAASLDIRPPAVATQINTMLLVVLFLVPLFITATDLAAPELSLTQRNAVAQEDAHIASLAAQLTPVGERIYVWGATPLLYVAAGRLSAHPNVLPGPLHVLETMDDLHKRPPRVLVVGGKLFSDRELATPGFENSVMALLRRTIKDQYQPVGTIGGTFVFRRNDAAHK